MVFIFRCYSCGLHFSDGPPPLEALSKQQSELVGIDAGRDPAAILCPALEDMSVYNFCSVCIVFAQHQLVWTMRDDHGHNLVHGRFNKRTHEEANPSCECGHVYEVPSELPFYKWIWTNRAIKYHLYQTFYPDQPLDFEPNLLAEV
jgi:hypothetical protein